MSAVALSPIPGQFRRADLARHTAGVTFTTKADAEAWLGAQQRTITDGTWERDAAAAVCAGR